MTKVVHLSSAHQPTDTRSFQKACRSLREAGYDVVYIVPAEIDQVIDDVYIRAVKRARNRFERMTRTLADVYRLAVDEDATIYHLHMTELLPVGQLLRARGKHVVFDMHENTPKSILSKSWIPGPMRKAVAWLYRKLERRLLRGIHVVFAETSYEQDYRWLPSTITTLNYPRMEEIAGIHATRAPRPTVGYIGRVTPERGSLTTLEALAILRDDGLDVAFECVGSGESEHMRALEAIARERGLPGAKFHGYLDVRAGLQIIAACQVGLAVLSPVPNYVDSFPTKMFEYMALGLPVIVSDFPLYRTVIEEAGCGVYIAPDDPRALAAAIRGLLDDPEAAAAMGARGREAALTRYNWTTEAEKLTRFYERILA